MGESLTSAADVTEILGWLAEAGISAVVDGGWAVDALLEEQTRGHRDLDIAIEHAHVPLLREVMASQGFTEMPRDDSRDCNFVLADLSGRELDVHSTTFNENGQVVFGVPYPAESLTGSGTIDGRTVRCITPEWLMKFHSGYRVDENDFHDVMLLRERFGLDLPPEFEAWVKP